MQIQNWKQCPVCGAELEDEFYADERDALRVTCPDCGKYAISAECYEDNIQNNEGGRKRLAVFLAEHKEDTVFPYISNGNCLVPNGYKGYPFWRVK